MASASALLLALAASVATAQPAYDPNQLQPQFTIASAGISSAAAVTTPSINTAGYTVAAPGTAAYGADGPAATTAEPTSITLTFPPLTTKNPLSPDLAKVSVVGTSSLTGRFAELQDMTRTALAEDPNMLQFDFHQVVRTKTSTGAIVGQVSLFSYDPTIVAPQVD